MFFLHPENSFVHYIPCHFWQMFLWPNIRRPSFCYNPCCGFKLHFPVFSCVFPACLCVCVTWVWLLAPGSTLTPVFHQPAGYIYPHFSFPEHCSTLSGRVQEKLIVIVVVYYWRPLLSFVLQYSPALPCVPATYLPFTCSCQLHCTVLLTSLLSNSLLLSDFVSIKPSFLPLFVSCVWF